VWEKIFPQRVAGNVFGQVCGNPGKKIFCTPKNLPAPTPMHTATEKHWEQKMKPHSYNKQVIGKTQRLMKSNRLQAPANEKRRHDR